jgi:hypothetical protein
VRLAQHDGQELDHFIVVHKGPPMDGVLMGFEDFVSYNFLVYICYDKSIKKKIENFIYLFIFILIFKSNINC